MPKSDAATLKAREDALDEREIAIIEREEAVAKAEAALAAGKPRAARAKRAPVRSIDLSTPAFGSTDGYGNMAQKFAVALERAGVHVRLIGTPANCAPMDPPAAEIFERSKTDTTRGDVLIFMGQPCGPTGSGGWISQSDRLSYGFSMFEASTVPAIWGFGIQRVSEVWVPSAHSAEIFRERTPAHIGIHVIPLGIEAHGPRWRRTRGPKLRFLHHCSHAEEARKGADLAIKAFGMAFPAERLDVELVLHSAFAATIVRSDTRVRLEVGRYDAARLNELYCHSDALVFPSRGEGFGLVPLEAMATGLPSIFPRSSGMLEYAKHSPLTVSVRDVPSGIGIGRAGAAPWALAADWYEPNLDEIVERMREVDKDYDRVQDAAFTEVADVAQDWSWESAAAKMLARLNSGDPLTVPLHAHAAPTAGRYRPPLSDIQRAS